MASGGMYAELCLDPRGLFADLSAGVEIDDHHGLAHTHQVAGLRVTVHHTAAVHVAHAAHNVLEHGLDASRLRNALAVHDGAQVAAGITIKLGTSYSTIFRLDMAAAYAESDRTS